MKQTILENVAAKKSSIYGMENGMDSQFFFFFYVYGLHFPFTFVTGCET